MSNRQLVVVLGGCMAVPSFGIDIMAPALSDLAADLDIASGTAQLTLTVAIAGFGLAQIPAGLLADRFGRRQLAIAGLLVFALASAAGALVSGLELLLVCRFVQGLCGGALGVASRALARDVASGNQAGHLLATMTSILALLIVIAPLAGGVVAGLWGWRWVLWVAALYSVAIYLLGRRFLPRSAPGPQRGETARRQMARSFRLFLQARQSLRGTAINALVFAGLFSFVTGGALVAVEVYGLSIAGAGLAMASVPFMLMFGSIASRQMVLRVGLTRMLMMAVLVLLVAGLWSVAHGLRPPAALVLAWGPFLCYGLAFGIFMPIITALVTDPLPATAGFVSSILGTTQAAAGTAASLLTAALYDGTLRPLAFIVAACALAACALYLISGPRSFVIAVGRREV